MRWLYRRLPRGESMAAHIRSPGCCGSKAEVRQLALAVQQRSNHNKAACALANKMARICYSALRDKAPFTDATLSPSRKLARQTFAMPA